MAKLTDKKRIKILEIARKGIAQGVYNFICEALSDIMNCDMNMIIFDRFPELVKHKPVKRDLLRAWWDENQIKRRINVLDSVITEIKAKSNA